MPCLTSTLFVLLHHRLYTCTLSSFCGGTLDTSVWREELIYLLSFLSYIPRGSCQRGGRPNSRERKEARNSDQEDLRNRVPCFWPLELSRLGARDWALLCPRAPDRLYVLPPHSNFCSGPGTMLPTLNIPALSFCA